MARAQSKFFCQACGHESLASSGRCAGCGDWEHPGRGATRRAREARPGARGRATRGTAGAVARRLGARGRQAEDRDRGTDRVLGGGLVPGLDRAAGRAPGSASRRSRGWGWGICRRPATGCSTSPGGVDGAGAFGARAPGRAVLSAVPALAETSLEAVTATLEAERPAACVIDPGPTPSTPRASQRPGSVGQVREAATGIMDVAKRIDCAVTLVGHVTTRTGRSPGHGCWSTSSTACSSSRASASAASAPCARSRTASGRPARSACSRCAPAGWSRSRIRRRASSPRRARPRAQPCCARWRARAAAGRGPGASGADRDRPAAPGGDRDRRRPQPPGDGARGPGAPRRPVAVAADVFVNVAGGVRIDEPGADLAVALALVSAHRGEALADSKGRPLACFGEIGLTGSCALSATPIGGSPRRQDRPRTGGRPRGGRGAHRPGAGVERARRDRRRAQGECTHGARRIVTFPIGTSAGYRLGDRSSGD